jgi:hypothetical protein
LPSKNSYLRWRSCCHSSRVLDAHEGLKVSFAGAEDKLTQIDRRSRSGATAISGFPQPPIEAQLSGEAKHPEPGMNISAWTVVRLEAYAASQDGQELERIRPGSGRPGREGGESLLMVWRWDRLSRWLISLRLRWSFHIDS